MRNTIFIKALFSMSVIFAFGFIVMGSNVVMAQCDGKVLQESDNGKVIALVVGKDFEIALPSNPTTGYDWQVAAGHEKAQAAFVEKSFVQASAGKGMVGVPGYTILKFRPGIEGVLELPLVYQRSWEKASPDDKRFTIQMVVGNGNNLESTDANRIMHINKGDSFTVILPSNPTTGYDWQLSDKMAKTGIVLRSSLFVPSANDAKLSGAPGHTVLFLEAKNSGVFELILKNRRSWEKENDSDETFSARLLVTDKGLGGIAQ